MRHPILGVVLLVLGCSTTPSGTVYGVHYELGGPEGGYALLEHGEREHVWLPADTDGPIIALRVQNPSHALDEPPVCHASTGIGTADHALLVGRDGQMFDGASVMVSLCSAEHPELLVMCSVYSPIGLAAPSLEQSYADLCRAIHVR